MSDNSSPRWGDLVEFEYQGETAEGTFLRAKFLWGVPKAEIQSGSESVWVPAEDVVRIIKRKENRRSDVPLLAERFRLRGGV